MRRSAFLLVLLFAVNLVVQLSGFGIQAPASRLPSRLSDQEFWKLAVDFSEPDGTFHAENLVSNEAQFQNIIPILERSTIKGRAYVGVGSEQNFTYITSVRPAIAFIVDIRRGNFDLHLIYKALFEMSADRADFVSRLFSRKRPAGLSPSSTAEEIFAAFDKAVPVPALYDKNLKEIMSHLVTKHGFKLSAGDRDGIAFVYGSWFRYGPDIQYELTGLTGRGGRGGGRTGGPAGAFPTYAGLMTATDRNGKNHSYLASEEAFRFVKDLETRNMVVPVVGNFAGPKALRSVAAFLKEQSVTVSAFYVSNVEQYLREDGVWSAFCSNVALFPIDDKSTFIRSERGNFNGQRNVQGGGFALELSPMKPEVSKCAVAR
jgi:hypothetical protein